MRSAMILATTLACACAAFAPAIAQNGLGRLARSVERAQKNFDIADRDRDGLVSREEAQRGPVPFIRAHFDAIDREHRGAVSKADVAAYVRARQRGRPAEAGSSR